MEKNIQSVPFTEKEVARLVNERNTSFGCFGISLVIFLLLAFVFLGMFSDSFAGSLGNITWYLIFLGPLAFFVGYGFIKSFGSGVKFYSDLKEGRKRIVAAPVEGKRVKFERNGKTGKRYQNFFLRAGGFTVRVPKTLYDEIKEGEIIEFQIAPHSETVFSEPKKLHGT